MSAARDNIRGAILNSTAPQSKVITFFGQEVEVRQQSLGSILSMETGSERKEQAVNMMLQYCYVPGTDDLVFEEADKEALYKLPFGPDMVLMQQTIANLTTIDIEGELGNSEKTS